MGKKTLRGATRGFKNRGRWDESFKDDLFQIPSKATKIRLFDEFDTIPHHWVEFFSKKKRGKTGFYALCLNWDYDEGEPADNGCPYCKEGMRVTNYVYGLCISRREQHSGVTTVRPIRLTPKCKMDILALTETAYPDEEYPEGWKSEDGSGPDATHPKYGFDITIKVANKNNKTEYVVSYADNGKVPLKKSEYHAFKSAAEQYAFSELAKAALETPEEVEQKLNNLGVYMDDDDDNGRRRSRKESTNYEDYDEIGDDDDDSPEEEERRPSGRKAQRARKVQSLTGDDDDLEEDTEARALPWEDDDEDEGGTQERTYAQADDDDAPDDDDEEYEGEED